MKEVKQPKKPLIFYYIIVLIVMMILNSLFFPRIISSHVEEVDYGTFLNMINNKEIATVQKEDNYIYFTGKTRDAAGGSGDIAETDGMQEENSTMDPLLSAKDTNSSGGWFSTLMGKNGPKEKIYKTATFDDPDLVNRLYESGCEFGRVVEQEMSPILSFILTWIFPIAIFVIIGQMLSRTMMKKMGGGMGSMQFGKSNAKVYVASETGIKFQDVAGEDEAKEVLSEIVDFLHNPEKYQEIGAKLPKGALLVGPPGTGKTLLAKAVAGEANVPFFSISGSEFVEMFVGMGAAKVRDLFKQANEKAPCIVFIDEIDTIGKKRDNGGMSGGNDEREQTLNQLLTEMDGFDGSKGVVILAATNRPDSLDPALLRPGRFDRRVPVELPDLKGREEILKVHAQKIRLGDDIDFNAVARAAAGASGAELANMVNEAALHAVRNGRQYVIQSDLQESIEVVIAGYQKKNKVLSNKEKLTVSYHEIGHALVAALQTNSAPVTKITIIPRTSGALGYTMQVDEGEHNLMSKEEIENKIATFTGGRVAEDLVFHSISTGASNDIEQATKLARAMITRYGMNEEFGMVALETVNNQYLGGDTSLACSPETSSKIDQKVIELVKTQYQKAQELLTEHMDKLHELSKYLYEKETITGEEFMAILNEPLADGKSTDTILQSD